jgi:hypothetical protein|tara:strand:- start:485 stop:1192 length:708 start_codon:yes stop_codon:yes gene_type:complete
MVERPKGVNMENITQLHKEVIKSLNKHKNSWLPLGMKLLELTDAIGDMKKSKYWKEHFNVPSFQHYCSEILKENPDTMSKYRKNAKCIRDYRNDLYEKWEEDNSIQIPGYTIFYELSGKKKVLSDDKFKEILDFIIDDNYSLSQVGEEIYDSIAKKSKVKKTQDDDEKTQLISYDKLEGREVLYVLRIPEIKDEIKSFYEGVEDDELKTVALLIDELLKHLRNLSLRHEGDENAE